LFVFLFTRFTAKTVTADEVFSSIFIYLFFLPARVS